MTDLESMELVLRRVAARYYSIGPQHDAPLAALCEEIALEIRKLEQERKQSEERHVR
jgi:hypothetical protein